MAHSRLCTLDGCSKPERARGLCGAHYEAARTAGTWTPMPCRTCGGPALPRQWYCGDECQPRCSVDDCGDSVQARGWCTFHYTRWKLHGDAEAAFVREKNGGLPCAFDGCDEPRRKSGLCVSHYSQQQKGIPLRPVAKWSPLNEPCPVCGTTERNVVGFRRFCGPNCTAHWHAVGGVVIDEVPCRLCGNMIDLRAASNGGRRKHSTTKLCRRCKQDSRKHGMSVEQLANRDGTVCGICSEIVDMALRAPNPMRASVDHILPRARGGTNDPLNLQLAHLACNCGKRDRITSRTEQHMP